MTGQRSLFAVVAALVAACAIIGALLAIRALPRTIWAAHPAQRGGNNPCTATVTKTLQPGTIRLCEQSQVTLGVQPSCPGVPVNIVFIVDETYKPEFSDPRYRTVVLRNAVERLALDKHPNTRVAVVWMQNGGATTKVDLTNDPQQVIRQLDVPPIYWGARPVQCFECGYREAVRILDRFVKTHPDVDINEITVLAPLGVYLAKARPGVLRGANMVKARKATSITGCFAWTHCVDELRQAASDARFYLAYGESNRLSDVLDGAVRQAIGTFLREVTITDDFPDTVEVITDSISPAAEFDPQARTVRWAFAAPIQPVYTLTYHIKPLILGAWRLGESSSVLLVDSHFREATVPVTAPLLSVPIDCLQTPTPAPTDTPQPPPTPTVTPTPTATDTPAATVTPSATPIRAPRPVYVPVALAEQCVPGQQRVDVALAIDASTSMLLPADATHTKLDVAVDAAREFLGLLRLDAGDQAAVVAFNASATLLAKLTSDRATLDGALGAIQTARQTCLVCAVDVAANELASARHKPANTPVLILLTDGQSNPRPASEAVVRAAQAKEAGVVIFTIGLGSDLDDAALAAIASQPSFFYRAPTAADLHDIYRQIAVTIPCPAEQFWGRR